MSSEMAFGGIQCTDCEMVFRSTEQYADHDCPGEPPGNVTRLEDALMSLHAVDESGFSPTEQNRWRKATSLVSELLATAQYHRTRED